MKFTASTISDQKRLVRGEQWLFVRRILRARDECHSAKWRVLILAGGAPSGEINAIRELMPRAHIVAIDKDTKCLEAAIDAGADNVIECDLYACERLQHNHSWTHVLPKQLRDIEPFDAIHLDFCGQVGSEMKRSTGLIFQKLMTTRGCMALTFSYGRDVVEMFMESGRSYSFAPTYPRVDPITIALPDDIPDSVAGRLIYMGNVRHIRSVMMYRGAAMPMVSVVYHKYANAYRHGISTVKVEPGDFELAVSYPDAVSLYDCPEDRIKSFRREFAAIKAVLTRQRQPKIPNNLIEVSEAGVIKL